MIYIVSSLAREAEVLAALCEQRSWPTQACRRVADFVVAADKTSPRSVIVRHRLEDGYSDDVLAYLGLRETQRPTRVIVLAAANCSPKEETRHLSLGADSVLRDPVRVEVLLEYLARHRMQAAAGSSAPAAPVSSYEFAGVQVHPLEHRLTRAGRSVRTTPRVIELLQLLHGNAGRVAPYPLLYSELFGRRFAGDTANCRVLLAKADGYFHRLGVNLRAHIRVIPKSGYLYPADETPDPLARA
jgi:two-component system, OmpR family, KDP operon response regulator KdpE